MPGQALRQTTCPSHPFPPRETRALPCRSRVRSSLVSLDSPPVVTWLHRTPKSWWLIEVDLHRGGSISLRPVSVKALNTTRTCSIFFGTCTSGQADCHSVPRRHALQAGQDMTSPSLPRPSNGAMRAIRRQRASTGSTTGKRVSSPRSRRWGVRSPAALGVTHATQATWREATDIVTWCVGTWSNSTNRRRTTRRGSSGAWRTAHLPSTFTYHPTEPNRDQFNIIKQLLGAPTSRRLSNAADAGREGELIFDLVYTCARAANRSNVCGSRLTREAILNRFFATYSQRPPIRGLRDSAAVAAGRLAGRPECDAPQ